MKAVDLVVSILKGYGWGTGDIWDVRVHLDYDSFEDWQLATLAKAIARISTSTPQEALADLKSALHELEKSKLIGIPCSCDGMAEAIDLGLVSITTVSCDGDSVPAVGISNHYAFSPLQYCPWCGNAAIEIKEVEDGTDNAS